VQLQLNQRMLLDCLLQRIEKDVAGEVGTKRPISA
jgi:hypothetical protein